MYYLGSLYFEKSKDQIVSGLMINNYFIGISREDKDNVNRCESGGYQ
jgi:hypothetical protein